MLKVEAPASHGNSMVAVRLLNALRPDEAAALGVRHVIDLRSDEEVKSGSIPGAVHIPMEQLESRMKDIPKDVALVFT